MKIAVIGDGGWGTATALLLSGYGHDVTVWGRSADYIAEIQATHLNFRYLPGVAIPPAIHWTADRAEAVKGAEIVVLASPSKFFGEVCASFRGLIPADMLTVSLTKGLCEKTHARMSELAREILGLTRVVVLSGPTHAEEVARGIPTTIVAAAENSADAKQVQAVWNGPRFRVYTSDDPVGVEMGGAVKNVIAIAVGCSDGLGFGDNTRAALITRGLAEVARFARAAGANPRTVSGLSGIGDLIVTCTSRHSRNHMVGERLGKGEKIAAIIGSMQMVAEGVWNAHVVRSLAKSMGVEMPITEVVYRMCYEDMPVAEAIEMLMNRPLKDEI
ncbi:MAG: NAD(P)-dependent glycerol-3-phosphate dehydrogenase [Kiritimatiellae bacterium]|nr:NAD(P)-dependent glycerol-3-phosphate dehydrogenase [Kiritimatiellia bacterium]